MKTDRELLEFAAKAAGIGPLDFDYAKREAHGMYFGPRLPMPQGVLMAAMWTYWRPLEDGDDALKLAVQLYLDISHQPDAKIEVTSQYVNEDDIRWSWESYGDDPQAATRRAIVRTAAAIGEKMP